VRISAKQAHLNQCTRAPANSNPTPRRHSPVLSPPADLTQINTAATTITPEGNRYPEALEKMTGL
jgi:hypothetical protein